MVNQKLIEVSKRASRIRPNSLRVFSLKRSDRRRPDSRQARVCHRRLARMASGTDRTAVDPGSVASYRSRVPGMSEIGERGDGDEVREMRMADVFGQQMLGR